MSKKRGEMGFNPENPNVLDDKKVYGYQLSANELEQYKRLRQRALAKGRRIKAKKGTAYYALGGIELERKQKGKEYFDAPISPYLDAKKFATKPQFESKEEFDRYVKQTLEFLQRGGEMKPFERAKRSLIKTLVKVDYNGSPDLDDLIDYIERMSIDELASMMTLPELYETIKDVYFHDEVENIDYLESFKDFTGYNVQTGQGTEKQWEKAYKKRYGREVRK